MGTSWWIVDILDILKRFCGLDVVVWGSPDKLVQGVEYMLFLLVCCSWLMTSYFWKSEPTVPYFRGDEHSWIIINPSYLDVHICSPSAHRALNFESPTKTMGFKRRHRHCIVRLLWIAPRGLEMPKIWHHRMCTYFNSYAATTQSNPTTSPDQRSEDLSSPISPFIYVRNHEKETGGTNVYWARKIYSQRVSCIHNTDPEKDELQFDTSFGVAVYIYIPSGKLT